MSGHDKRGVIIGASGGIGLHLVEQLAAEGWRLVLAGRTEESLNAAAEIAPDAIEATSVVDARDMQAVAGLLDAHPETTGLVNLAGSILLKPAHATSADDFAETMDLNATTAFAVIRAAGRTMRKAGGSVVLMSSCAARVGLPNHEAISAAKAAVEGMTRSAAATYAKAGLRFNTVAPGLTDTPMASPLTRSEASLKASEARHPLGRIGQPAEIARAIAFLLSPENAWITGQVIGVDGGLAQVRSR